MRILLFGFGSRGDVQPFIALGKGLCRAGYEVTLAAGINFRPMVEAHGLDFAPIHVDVEAAMQTEGGKDWLENSTNPLQELRNMKRMADSIAPQVAEDVLRMAEGADVLVSGLLAAEVMGAVAKVRGKRHLNALMSPVAPTGSGALGMQAMLPGRFSPLNRWQGYLVLALFSGVLRSPSDTVRHRLGLPAVTRGEFIRALNRTPTLLGISPLVAPPPPDWDTTQRVTGYWFLDAPEGWQPDAALETFLAAGGPPVYIGFGSMTSRDPQGTTQIMIEALRKSGQRGILHSGWAGLHAEDLPPDIFLIDGAPHDWLFPRMAAVVHHGGAGTTSAALRAGVPSVAVAHMGDQPYWGRRIHELGAGAPPLRRHKLTADQLAETITLLAGDPRVRQRAADLGARIRAEDGVGEAVRAVGEWVGA